MKMIFYSHVNKTLFRKKGFAFSLVLKPRNAYFIATIPDNDNYDKLIGITTTNTVFQKPFITDY